jgi:predicted dithiol-disulfide oxidoreductase (DUF899 family)
MIPNTVVSRDEWLAARTALLAEEKAMTKALDALSARRRELPWVKVEEEYVFDGPNGKESLADLFQGRSQLIVQHFMFAPGWTEGCVGCSHSADHVDAARQHFEPRDVAFAAVSRAPLAEFEPFRQRMGWRFHWVSSAGTSFNYDYGVSFTPEATATGNVGYNYGASPYAAEDLPGVSVFARDEAGSVYHTYSTYARGLDILLGSHNYLDLTPKGRNELRDGRDVLRHHDRYDDDGLVTIARKGGGQGNERRQS